MGPRMSTTSAFRAAGHAADAGGVGALPQTWRRWLPGIGQEQPFVTGSFRAESQVPVASARRQIGPSILASKILPAVRGATKAVVSSVPKQTRQLNDAQPAMGIRCERPATRFENFSAAPV